MKEPPVAIETSDCAQPSSTDVSFPWDLRIATCTLVALHIYAVFTLISPTLLISDTPILGADHPAHAYRVDVYRRALSAGDAAWGYDPRFGGGSVMRPTQDAGAKPQQFLGVVLPSISPHGMIKWFLFVTALTFPLWPWMGMRCLGLSTSVRVWGLAILLGVVWLYTNFRGFLQWGLVAYSFASFLLPLAFACYLNFLKTPSAKWFLFAIGTLSVVLCLHVLGLVLIGWTFILALIKLPEISARWRVALCVAPVMILVVNGFWLLPFTMDYLKTPVPSHRKFATYPNDLTYTSLEHLVAMLSPLRVAAAVIGLGGACIGWQLMKRRVGSLYATAWCLSGLLGVVLKFGGSYVPIVVKMQPSRFLLTGFVLLTVPAAVTAAALCCRLRFRQSIGIALFSILLVLVALFHPTLTTGGRTHINYAGKTEYETPTFLSLPQSVPVADIFDELTTFVKTKTQDHDRLLVQTVVQAETRMLALQWRREVVGNTYPDAFDAANFTLTNVLGRSFDEWTAPELQQAMDLWGIDWVFTATKDAAELIERSLAINGVEVGGGYRAYRVTDDRSRFLIGSGRVNATLNRFELSDLETQDGCCVLKYRYCPGIVCEEDGDVFRYSAAGIPEGLIGVRTSKRKLTLKLDPWVLFGAQWAASTDACKDIRP